MDRTKYSLKDLANLASNNAQEREKIMISIAHEYEQKGEAIGMQKGIQKGRQEGIQQGARNKALHIAKNMLSNLHLDMQTVSQATGLSQVELMKLQEAGQGKK